MIRTGKFTVHLSASFRQLSGNTGGGVKPFEDIPGPWPSLPFIGTTWQSFKFVGKYKLSKLHESFMDKYRQYGPIIKEEYQRGKAIVTLFDPNDFETVFRNQGNYPIRPPNVFVCHYRSKMKSKYPNVGISNLLGEEWCKQRRLVAPITMKAVVHNNFSEINKVCRAFSNYLWKVRNSSNVVEDIQNSTYRLALEAIAYFSLGVNLKCLSTEESTADGENLISATKDLFTAFHQLHYGTNFWKISTLLSPSYQLMASAESRMHEITSKYIQEAFNKLKAGTCNGNTPVEVLIKKQGLSEEETGIMMMDFIAGGTKTVSTTLAFLFHHLAANPRAQDTLYKELSSRIGDVDHLKLEHLNNLPYLKACLKEIFRVSTTIPTIARILPKDTVLSGYNVPAGTPVLTAFYVPSRSEEYFEKPDEFMPERWLRDHKKDLHPFCSLPFGFGTRQCVGRWFSEMQLYLATINTVMRYKLESDAKKLDCKMAFIIVPKNNVQIKLTARV